MYITRYRSAKPFWFTSVLLRKLRSNRILHSPSQGHCIPSPNILIITTLIQSPAFRPDPPQRQPCRIRLALLPGVLLELPQLVQRRILYIPLLPSLLFKLSQDLIRRRSERVQLECSTARLLPVRQGMDDEFPNTARVSITPATKKKKKKRIATYSPQVTKLILPFPSPSSTAFRCLTSKLPPAYPGSLFAPKKNGTSAYGPVTTNAYSRSFVARRAARTFSFAWCGFSDADAGLYSMSVPYSEGRKRRICGAASAHSISWVCAVMTPRPRAETTVSIPVSLLT